MERRSAPRHRATSPVRFATVSERPVPETRLVDASESGVLVAVSEPIGLPLGTRVCCSVGSSDGMLHLIGDVRRVERGTDFRTYVAIELLPPFSDVDRNRLEDWIAEVAQFRELASS